MEYEHEKACALYAVAQERSRILEIINKWNCSFIDRMDLIKAIKELDHEC